MNKLRPLISDSAAPRNRNGTAGPSLGQAYATAVAAGRFGEAELRLLAAPDAAPAALQAAAQAIAKEMGVPAATLVDDLRAFARAQLDEPAEQPWGQGPLVGRLTEGIERGEVTTADLAAVARFDDLLRLDPNQAATLQRVLTGARLDLGKNPLPYAAELRGMAGLLTRIEQQTRSNMAAAAVHAEPARQRAIAELAATRSVGWETRLDPSVAAALADLTPTLEELALHLNTQVQNAVDTGFQKLGALYGAAELPRKFPASLGLHFWKGPAMDALAAVAEPASRLPREGRAAVSDTLVNGFFVRDSPSSPLRIRWGDDRELAFLAAEVIARTSGETFTFDHGRGRVSVRPGDTAAQVLTAANAR